MSRYKSKTSTEIKERLKQWQEQGNPEDAIWLADQIPHLLEDVARVQIGFLTLREKVRKLESEMTAYKHTRLLEAFEDEQQH